MKRLQVPLPHGLVLTLLITLILSQNFKKYFEDYGVPNDPMRYRNENFIGAINVAFIGLMITLALTP